ncbi:aldo/keto reductase [Paenibacillus sp. F411]|uniref:aldo/keto reductase n=1 Tax=unclassified Paenibacillus TaxID=185978 RepID=UPI001AAE5912|nr:aldo/keto reductase [Paenibacillus sp. F411]MBO2942978.1 aldo/keto reductase [Paenibacillus sp. F411]
MERRAFGNTGMNVSILGFGGSEIRDSDQATVNRLLHSALDAGLNMIDTAECYGSSEELIGQALKGRRSEAYLFTKCGHADGIAGHNWDPKVLAGTIDRSLKRLQVDNVDVIHLHSCSAEILRQGDVIEVLQRAKEAGKTRFIGYSGDADDAYAAVQSGVFDSFQTSLNIADQQSIELTIPVAAQRGMGIIAKRPIANVAWKHETMEKDHYGFPYWERLKKLQYEFLQDTDADSDVEQALKFTLSVPGVATAIVGTNNPNRWQQNASLLAGGSALSQPAYEAIRARWKEISSEDWIGQI